MSAYMSQGAGVLLVVRSEHRMGLRELTLALYHSNEELGKDLSARRVRKTVSLVLMTSGTNVITTVCDYIREAEEFDEGSLVGSDVEARLEWARRLVLKAYRKDFTAFPDVVAAFEALPSASIV